jgi:hypothetical protein
VAGKSFFSSSDVISWLEKVFSPPGDVIYRLVKTFSQGTVISGPESFSDGIVRSRLEKKV